MAQKIAAFYQFAPLPDFEARQTPLLATAKAEGVFGTILLASEGVNGTIAGPRDGVIKVVDQIKSFPGCADMPWKQSESESMPFHRMKVRLKKEIVTMGVTGLEPEKSHERYAAPEDWNEILEDPDTVVIDTRNDYEISIGKFEGAIDPGIKSFREFPEWFRNYRKNNNFKKVAMYCTGGIRCEKSTAFLRSEGIENVVHLEGGILKYLEKVQEKSSLWRGECFVFDQRVSVTQDLSPGQYNMCYACRRPLSKEDMLSHLYQEGVSCPHCFEETSSSQKKSYAERQLQVELAETKGENHIGVAHSGNNERS